MIFIKKIFGSVLIGIFLISGPLALACQDFIGHDHQGGHKAQPLQEHSHAHNHSHEEKSASENPQEKQSCHTDNFSKIILLEKREESQEIEKKSTDKKKFSVQNFSVFPIEKIIYTHKYRDSNQLQNISYLLFKHLNTIRIRI